MNEQIRSSIADMKGQAASSARTAANKGKEKAHEALSNIGKMFRDSASTIDENVGTQYGNYARKAADSVENFANRVDEKEVDQIVDDAREFVKKSPAVAIGAAAAIGFVMMRLLKSGRDDQA
ncbi:hypothetical protein [Sphingorhabdus lutea]|nr:hypothetical protein [Sphingorhabdus lutea]